MTQWSSSAGRHTEKVRSNLRKTFDQSIQSHHRVNLRNLSSAIGYAFYTCTLEDTQ
uniref:Uncharacterized protein n=1 Tax=Anguilla anguilla TaxID=7936 RepID=A0A0E9SL19_ANGAN